MAVTKIYKGNIVRDDIVKIYKGNELIYEAVPQGETWVINESPTGSGSNTYSINFTSNDNSYSTMLIESTKYGLRIRYGYDTYDDAYWAGWLNQAYRTVTFETAPTGDLLTWLQTNAVKQ